MSYEDAFSSVYDIFTADVAYPKRAAYIQSLFNGYGITKGVLLDLACGTGALTEEFCKMGYELIGVDSSESMLSVARQRFTCNNQNVLLLCQDMTELDLYGTVNCAVCSLDSLNHLKNEIQLKKVFKRLSLFIEPGGVFVFDVNTEYKHSQVLSNNTFVYENESSFLVWQNSLQADNKTVDIMLDIFTERSDGTYERESEDFCEVAFSTQSIASLLEQAGFCDIKQYGDMSTAPPAKNEERIYFSAVKK